MQATLVSYYGTKSASLAHVIQTLQNRIAEYFGDAFYPYEVDQVHGTIVTLDGIVVDDLILNKNFFELRDEKRIMNFKRILYFLRNTNMLPIDIQIGGFQHDIHYPFTSQSQHPYYRSFSIQEDIVSIMGWPKSGDEYPKSLDLLRRNFQHLNVLHRYYKHPIDVDNDFYLVLGRLDKSTIDEQMISEVESVFRDILATSQSINVTIDQQHLAIVGYVDTRLPLDTSVFCPIWEVTEDWIQNLYLEKCTSS